MRSPHSSAFSPLTRVLSGSRLCPIAKWTSLYHMLVKVTKLPKNVQVSWSLLELCRRHVVVLQAQILQVVNIRQLVVSDELHHLNFYPHSRRLLIAQREIRDTSCSSVADGSRQTGGPFLLRKGVGAQRIAENSRFGAFSWDVGLHQRFIISTR